MLVTILLPACIFLLRACLLSLSLFSPPLCLVGLWLPRLAPVVGIWARTVQYPAPTPPRAPPPAIYSSIPINNHPAITNTNRSNKVRGHIYVCVHVACSSACLRGPLLKSACTCVRVQLMYINCRIHGKTSAKVKGANASSMAIDN